MSLKIEKALRDAAEKVILEFILSGESRLKGATTRADFSSEELRIIKEIEKNPGMKQSQIVSIMSVDGSGPEDVTCEAGTTKVLLANLVKRRVLKSSATEGYTV